MILVGCGDSWAFGHELLDYNVIPKDVFEKGISHSHHFESPHKEYREKNRYLGILAEKLNVKKTVDLSQAAAPNDRILRTLVNWLTENNYTNGRDTSELFVSIGWSSPERVEFNYEKKWGGDNYIDMGPHVSPSVYDKAPNVGQFSDLYFKHFSNYEGIFNRYLNQVFYAELLLKKYNINYIMHQAFYQFNGLITVDKWDDKKILVEAFSKMTNADKALWLTIDPVRFMNRNSKDIATFHHYLKKQTNNMLHTVFYNWHPNENGHKIWADYMYDYIIQNKLIG